MNADPIKQFEEWLQQAVHGGVDLPNAAALATASKDGLPTVRYVLLKGISAEGLVFYTHASSVKGRQLAENPHAAMVVYWSRMDRQIRIEGTVDRVTDEEADEYFASRPRASRISAWVAPQSSIIENREYMEERIRLLEREFEGGDVPRPEDWAGYRISPETIEFWQGRADRLHDRFLYRRAEGGNWAIQRLAP